MRWPLRFRGLVLVVPLLFLVSLTPACSPGESAEAGAVGTTAAAPLAVTFSTMYLTLENRAGIPLVDARVEIIPRGVRPPFRTVVSRLEGSERREVPYNQFRSADGTPFQRGNLRTRSLKITATDITGKAIQQEVPFN